MFGVDPENKNRLTGTLSVPGKFRILARHFLQRLHNFELVATDVDSRNTIVQILVLLSLPGQFLPFWFFSRRLTCCPFLQHQHRAILSFEYYFISFSMIITGLVTVLNWSSLFPDQSDHAILSPLPLHARVLFGSKLTALLIFQLTFTFIINISSTFLFPYFAYVRIDSRESELLWTFVHAFSIVAGNLLILVCLMCIQGLSLLLASALLYPKLSLLMQFGLFILLQNGLLMIPEIETHLAAYCRGDSQWLKFLPPTWILGLYESLMGRAYSPMTSPGPLGMVGLGRPRQQGRLPSIILPAGDISATLQPRFLHPSPWPGLGHPKRGMPSAGASSGSRGNGLSLNLPGRRSAAAGSISFTCWVTWGPAWPSSCSGFCFLLE
jgi:hypothetical protein